LFLAPVAAGQTVTPPDATGALRREMAQGVLAATPDPAALQQTENILVLGADVRPGPWMMHTDSMMLVAIDEKTRQVGMLSIPRDLWVDIPGWGADRINKAYFVGDYKKFEGGGPALAKQVVEKTLGVPIKHVVMIKMDGLEQLVNASEDHSHGLPLYGRRGPQTRTGRWLDLPQAKAEQPMRKFATYRYLTSDFVRPATAATHLGDPSL
jgi:hypothetical protein